MQVDVYLRPCVFTQALPVVEGVADQLLADLLELRIEDNRSTCVFLCSQTQVDEGLGL